jgi:hypothetical protein
VRCGIDDVGHLTYLLVSLDKIESNSDDIIFDWYLPANLHDLMPLRRYEAIMSVIDRFKAQYPWLRNSHGGIAFEETSTTLIFPETFRWNIRETYERLRSFSNEFYLGIYTNTISNP